MYYTVSEISKDETINQRLNMFREQQKRVMEQIAELQETLDVIKFKCWYYETAQTAKTCAVHDSLKPEDMPEDIRDIKEKTKKCIVPNKLKLNTNFY